MNLSGFVSGELFGLYNTSEHLPEVTVFVENIVVNYSFLGYEGGVKGGT